ncbi:mitochondrial fission ELM1 family protein [Pelagibacteraceae bacterium]|nr:mitochondrial fission ELM1 family protein [Pelagibacteraceae bacterium]
MNNFKTNKLAWCLTDGSAGMISQVRGLAEALNVNYELKVVKLNFPWSKLPVNLLPLSNMMFKNLSDFNLDSKAPDILISCGKRSIYASLFIKKKSIKRVFSIHIQNPRVNTNNFDIVVAPSHDNVIGHNVITTDLAINHITPKLLDKHAEKMKDTFGSIQKPICTVFIGGKSRNYKFDQSNVIELAKTLDKVMNNNNVQMFIVFSRRTDKFIKDYLKKKYSKQNIVWEGKDNPYLALMHYSKYLICTSDSVSIISESVSSKKPVFIYKLPSSKRYNRIDSFLSTLVEKNYVKILSDKLEDYSNSYTNETMEVARTINESYNN